MLINAIRTAPVAPQQPKAAAPTPAPPADTAIETLDTAPKAALLPALSATTMLLTLSAMGSAAQHNAGLTSTLDVTVGDSTKETITYKLEQNKFEHSFTLNGKGTLGSTGAGEKWILNQDGLLVNGSFGNAIDVQISGPGPITVSFVPENVKVSPSQNGLKIEGDVGGVHVSETMTAAADGTKIQFAGTIGGRALDQTLTIAQDNSGKTVLHVEGHLGDDAIKYDEALTPKDQNTFQLSGDGMIAGYKVHIDHQLAFDPANPPPQV